jgi:hypothetical protein
MVSININGLTAIDYVWTQQDHRLGDQSEHTWLDIYLTPVNEDLAGNKIHKPLDSW